MWLEYLMLKILMIKEASEESLRSPNVTRLNREKDFVKPMKIPDDKGIMKLYRRIWCR